MNSNPLLIFDLDDTIFETRSIGRKNVAAILDTFRESISAVFSPEEITLVISDLWKYPFDYVAKKHQLSEAVRQQFAHSVNRMEYDLELQTFPDFEFVRSLEAPKVLVTTGFIKLQLAKITALKLEEVFEALHIDEINDPNRIHKKGIFKQLIASRNTAREDVFVIGDNPDSELKAGRELGLTTIQVAKLGQPKSANADFYLQHFRELHAILNGGSNAQ